MDWWVGHKLVFYLPMSIASPLQFLVRSDGTSSIDSSVFTGLSAISTIYNKTSYSIKSHTVNVVYAQ